MTKIEVVIFGKVYSFANEPDAVRFLKVLKGSWDKQDEVRLMSPEGTSLARWRIADFLS